MFEKVTILKNQIGLVFKKGNYETFLTEGEEYLWNKEVKKYNLSDAFFPPVELDILLSDSRLAALLEVVDINDSQLGICFEEGKFKRMLTIGRYVYWKKR